MWRIAPGSRVAFPLVALLVVPADRSAPRPVLFGPFPVLVFGRVGRGPRPRAFLADWRRDVASRSTKR